MRRSGIIETARGLRRHDHVGWSFDRAAAFRADAAQFLAEGLAAHERVMYVGGADTVAPPGMEAAVARGQAEITSVAAMYSAGEPIEPERQVATFSAAADQAIADGWTGLRVAADVTSLVRSGPQREAWIRYEHLVDSLIAGRPITGLCGFDRRVLDRDVLAQVSCQHPALSPDSSEFRFYPSPGARTGVTLAGEIDPDNRHALVAVLRAARPRPADGRITIDATALTFVDHHSLALLAAYADGLGVTAVLRTPRNSVAKMITDLVPMGGLEVQVVSA